MDGIASLFGVSDAKISKMLTDPTGGAATYDAAVDVPGIQSVSMSPEFTTKELPGDDEIVDIYSKIKKITGSVKHGQISLPVLAIIMGGAISDTGVTPNRVRTWDLVGTDKAPSWKLEAQITYLGQDSTGGDWHTILYRCKVTKLQVEAQGEDYAIVSFDFDAIPLKSNGKLWTKVENETAVSVAAGAADTTAPTATVVPANSATGVLINANVVWTFDEQLQPGCISSDNFLLVKDDGTLVAGALSASTSAPWTVTLNPTSDLANSADYISLATTGARDLAGNRMAAALRSHFTTVAP